MHGAGISAVASWPMEVIGPMLKGEVCRFTRQGLAPEPEPVRARRFTTLQNPVSPATRARGLPVQYQQTGPRLLVSG